MRIGILTTFLAGVLWTVSSLQAQAQTQSTPPTSPAESIPAPVPAPADTAPALPAYGSIPPREPSSVPTSEPTPTPKPPPSTTPGPPTAQEPVKAYAPYGKPDEDLQLDHLGSAYIPVDSWVYPAMTRLYSLGYVDTMFLGMRPWTRRSLLHMLQESHDAILSGESQEAQNILASMLTELSAESLNPALPRGTVYGLQSGYVRLLGIGGDTLRDSLHLGQTISNDYGRPYQPGFNSITGFSTLNEWGRFSLYVRGEQQHSPSGPAYPDSVVRILSANDNIPYGNPGDPKTIIPLGTFPAENPFRIVEANLSFHLLGHEISGGKSDAWLGPAQGGAFAWSNNAENIYSFRINRVEPLRVPLVSRLLGPMRYDFFYGSLKGHSVPNHPYTHSEMFSFRPTANFEFGFQRTIIFGGAGHAPVNLHTFLIGFFSTDDTTGDVKYSREDPGARFSVFNFSWRLPAMRKYATFYVDSIAHDDVSPISAPRRAAFRTGLYLSQIPKLPKLDLRLEAASTDPNTGRSVNGSHNYVETIQLQGYTNKGFIMGDWIGREAKGGQAWLTYHLSGKEWIQLQYLNKKTPKDFVAGGTTQNQFKVNVVKRIGQDIEINAWVQHERWKAPIYLPGLRTNTVGAFQITWFPKLRSGSSAY